MGEMEVECNWSHGIMGFLKEKLMDCSDNYLIYICAKCGLITHTTQNNSNITVFTKCKTCDNRTQFKQLRIPFAFKFSKVYCNVG